MLKRPTQQVPLLDLQLGKSYQVYFMPPYHTIGRFTVKLKSFGRNEKDFLENEGDWWELELEFNDKSIITIPRAMIDDGYAVFEKELP